MEIKIRTNLYDDNRMDIVKFLQDAVTNPNVKLIVKSVNTEFSEYVDEKGIPTGIQLDLDLKRIDFI